MQFTGKNTFFGKTASMLQQSGGELGHLQKILLTIMFVLVVTSFILCGTAFGYLLGMGEPFKEALSFTVVLLVASIPIAIEIVCTTTLALGSRELSRHGAIVTRLAAIEDMAGMNMLCSDKTGTLTLNKMAIQVRDGEGLMVLESRGAGERAVIGCGIGSIADRRVGNANLLGLLRGSLESRLETVFLGSGSPQKCMSRTANCAGFRVLK